MTTKEAIEQLEYIKEHQIDPEDFEVFDRAIKALENAWELHKWLDPDIDPELALEKIRGLVYFGEEAKDE